MRIRWLSLAMLVFLLLSVVLLPRWAAPAGADPPGSDGQGDAIGGVSRLESVAISTMPPKAKRLARPRAEVVENLLRNGGIISAGSSAEQVEAATATYYKQFAKRTSEWVSPEQKEWALNREAELATAVGPQAIQPVTAKVFALAVEFANSADTFAAEVYQDGSCVSQTVTTKPGPLKGQIPQPGSRDNNTVWYTPDQTANASFYEKLIFGYDGVGRVRMDLTDPVDHQPGINLAGYTVQDYYDRVAGLGNVTLSGTVKGWVAVNHSEGYYGIDNCTTGDPYGGGPVPVAQLVIDAVDEFIQANPGFDWRVYDDDQDGFVDTFWIIHAGMGQEAGGGAQGDEAIWSHSSDLRFYGAWPSGYKVYEGNPGTASDDIYIGPYTMQPENLDLGVLVEEFGHNFFGLPDLYTTDVENSIGFWDMMGAGSWMGYLGGATPSGMPLWFRMIARCGPNPCNWQEPMVTRTFSATQDDITIGRLESTPSGQMKGVQVTLPDVVQTYDNEAGSGNAAWTETGRDSVDLTLDRRITIPTSGAGLLTFDSYWDIEEGYDYGYVMLRDGANPWVFLKDLDGVLTSSNPTGANLGWGLTGTASAKATLRFDLSAYKGRSITLRLRYRTDTSVTYLGWWIDNVKLNGGFVDAFEAASAPGTFPGWTNSTPGWAVAPVSRSYVNYYLVEWRAPTKYDQMVRTAYVTAYSDEDEWEVQRVPYNIPGALLYYRNAKYSSTYALEPNMFDPPSLGPKYQLLIVDMNWQPMRITSGANFWTLSSRPAGYDAALTLQPTQALTLTKYWTAEGQITGNWTFASKPAVTSFDDAKGYYAGVYAGTPCPSQYQYCYSARGNSAVIPARGNYTTRVTHFDGTPYTEEYGNPLDPFTLGTGNPGDENKQWGVRILLLSKAGDNSTATLRFLPGVPWRVFLPLVRRGN